MSIGSSDNDVHCPQVDIRVHAEADMGGHRMGRIRPHNYINNVEGYVNYINLRKTEVFAGAYAP